MAIWSRKSNSSNNTSVHDDGRVGGLSADAHSNDRRRPRDDGQITDMTVSDYMTSMPNISLRSLFKGLMKQILWVIPVFLIGCFAIFQLTKDIKRSYRGEGRLLVQIGPEYIYTPIGANSNNSGGVSQTPDTIALNEVGIMKNSEIIDQVIGIMTSARGNLSERQAQDLFNERAFEKIREAEANGSKREIEDAYSQLHKAVSNSYHVVPQPKSSLIDVAYEHEDPEIAVEMTNQFIDAYRVYRREVFVEGSEDTISERRDETEKQLKSNELKIARFLERNNISDFTSEQDGLRNRSEALKAELNMLRGLMSETESSLATVDDQLRGTPQTINLYVDDRASQRIAQAELELKQLLAKYLPTSNPVRQKQTELNELKALLSANNGKATGGRRVGPNPVYQTLLTRRNTLKASADSYREKEFTLQKQLDSAVSKVRQLTKISPEYQNLLRERKTLSAALDTYNARAQEALVDLAQAEANNENIKVISYANFAIKGQNVGKLIWAGGSLAWALTLMMLALLAVFLNPENFKAPSKERKGPRRSRSTDYDNASDKNIPEPISPYVPDMPLPATGSAMMQATREYNEAYGQNSAAQMRSMQQTGSQGTASYMSVAPEVTPYEAAPYETTPHTQNPYEAPAAPPNPVADPLAYLDMSNNPYLNMHQQTPNHGGTYDTAFGRGGNLQAANSQATNSQINGLPVLGSFSAAKG